MNMIEYILLISGIFLLILLFNSIIRELFDLYFCRNCKKLKPKELRGIDNIPFCSKECWREN